MDERVVGAGDREADRFVDIEGPPAAIDVLEGEDDLVPLLLHPLVDRAVGRDAGHLVGVGERPAGEPLAHIQLVLRVDVLPLADVDDHCLAGVRQGLHRHRLRFTQLGPGALARLGLLGVEVGQLHPVEGEVAHAPLLAPRLDHEGEEGAVLVGAAGVRFPLIPDRATDAVADRGRQHAGVDVAGAVVAKHVAIGIARLPRGLLPLCLGLLGRRLPFDHRLVIGRLLGRILGLGLLPPLEERLEAGIGGKRAPLHPRLGSAPAPGVVDQPHRHTEGLVELAAEEVADRREVADRLGGAGLPRAVEAPLRILRADLRHRDQADLRELRRGPFEIGIGRGVHAPLHV